MNALRVWFTRERWPWVAALFVAAMLAAAHAFQAFGYAPCSLCLRQREVYWVLLGVCAGRIALGYVSPAVRRSPISIWLIAALFLFSAGLAAYHAGVEWKLWEGPSTCASGAPNLDALNIDDLSGVLSGETRVRPPVCDEAPWIFGGLSMAGWNALASLAMFGLSLAALRRRARAPI